MVSKDKVDGILRGLSNKQINVIINNKKSKSIHSNFLLKPYIEFDGDLDDLNDTELKAVVSHELCHINERHQRIMLLIIIVLTIITLLIMIVVLLDIDITLNIYYSIAVLLIAIIIVDSLSYIFVARFMEGRADLYAAKRVAKESMINALDKIKDWRGARCGAITHGSIESRIKRLEKSG